MDVGELIKLRTLFKSIQHTYKQWYSNEYPTAPVLDENGIQKKYNGDLPMIIQLDNEHAADESITPVIWDDTNQLIYYFDSNYTARTSVMSGINNVPVPMIINGTDYTEIQRIRLQVDEKAYRDFMAFMKDKASYDAIMAKSAASKIPSGQVTDDVIKSVFSRYFDRTNAVKEILDRKPPEQTNFNQKWDSSKPGGGIV